MPIAAVENLNLAYQIYGQQHSQTLVMIQGLSMQLCDWPALLIDKLSSRYRVVVFDNRDIGLSDKLTSAANMDSRVGMFDQEIYFHRYDLFDMAEDTLQLLDYLNIQQCHLLGFSMGGMIAQIVAATSAQRILSLVSLCSSAGQEEIYPSAQARLAMELSACEQPLSQAIEQQLLSIVAYTGSGYPLCKESCREAVIFSLTRSHCPAGIYRQCLAMRASGDRSELLRAIKAPTLLVHGSEDPCIPLWQAEAAIDLIDNAKLAVIQGLGHDLPDSVIPKLGQLITNHLGSTQSS